MLNFLGFNPFRKPSFLTSSLRLTLSREMVTTVPHLKQDQIPPVLYPFHFQHSLSLFLQSFPQPSAVDSDAVGHNRLVRQINVFDFDNTLFRSPCPNSKIWHYSLISKLKDDLSWYQDARTLAEPYVVVRKPHNSTSENDGISQWFVPEVVCLFFS